jgi:hypothetical protein
MSIQMKLWRIEEDRPVLLAAGKLGLESRLEQWICQDLSLVGENLLLLGNQVATDSGHQVDILALDGEGNLVILELKRGRTPRDVVAQVLDYASWACELSREKIEGLAAENRKKPLAALFQDCFGTPVPDILNADQRLVIVATELDPQSERIVQYLSDRHSVNINVVFFDYYRHMDQEFIGRSWLIAPSEVERKVRAASSSKRSPLLTLEDLAGIADERGVGELYRTLHDGLTHLCDQVGTTQSNVTYRWRVPAGGRSALVSVHPKASSSELGLIADIRVDDLSRHLNLPPESLRAALSDKLEPRKTPGLYLYGEGYAFRKADEIGRFLSAIGRERVDG